MEATYARGRPGLRTSVQRGAGDGIRVLGLCSVGVEVDVHCMKIDLKRQVYLNNVIDVPPASNKVGL